ncbi:substrate-binding periplasmic protein [Rhizobium tumorigenes]|uniref:Transporter substrate-binding domain-containing protein n=1 Tax=Rhizobium tumorigenes TaxID=2041385 RepID=A0AAF1KSD7_9HYPH|nr:transporter substrate-binding domain-containing protein [Rhizobium tumorigenes]WFR97827.1 transporter substrate-binding domain-containing protein [Rhizobium tumorigenes]
MRFLFYKVLLGAVALTASISSRPAAAVDRPYHLSEPNVLSVAITGDMPGLVVRDGRLAGYDGDILQIAADKLGLVIKPVPMEWTGAIAAVQTGRVDIIGGNVAWTKQRADTLALTDPTGYFQNGVTSREDAGWHRLKDLENRKVGSMTGFSFLPELHKISGLELTLYDSTDAALRDLHAGRIEALVGDPPVIDYALSKNPAWHLVNLPFSDNDFNFPLLTGLGRQYVFGLSKQNADLAADLSTQIRALWTSCEVRTIGKRYGNVSEANYTPAAENFRAGVDRAADWTPPVCGR